MCDSDKPIFKVEEAILNYAEAACDSGSLTKLQPTSLSIAFVNVPV